MNGIHLTENARELLLSRVDLMRKLAAEMDVDINTVRRMLRPNHRKHYRLFEEKSTELIEKYLSVGMEELTEKGGIHA